MGKKLVNVVQNATQKPDVIILDVEMPNLGGIATLPSIAGVRIKIHRY